MPTLLTTTLNGGITPGMSGTGARASYALVSYSPANSVGGFALYDGNWCPPTNNGYPSGYSNYSASNVVYLDNSTNANYVSIFSGASDTNTQASSSGTPNFLNSTNAAGEFGNAWVDIFSDGTHRSARRSSGDNYNKHNLNAYAINSDHANKRNVYLLFGGNIRMVDRLYGTYNYPMAGTRDYAVSSLNTSMQGSASYHYGRKELTILSYNATGGSYNVITFQNVDFNLYPDPYVALNRAEVVRVNSTVSLAASWSGNYSEGYYNLKPVVTDNGTVYVSVMFPNTSLALYSFTRSGTSASTGTYVAALTATTSYGIDQGQYYGQRQITSRDGTSVATFSPYYYYGAGINCFMIDKTNNTYGSYTNTNTSAGFMCVPYQNSGWVFSFCGNCYASNWSGGYIATQWMKAATGGFVQVAGTSYYTQFPNPNTTNYPALTQVVDFVLLPGNPVGPKLSA